MLPSWVWLYKNKAPSSNSERERQIEKLQSCISPAITALFWRQVWPVAHSARDGFKSPLLPLYIKLNGLWMVKKKKQKKKSWEQISGTPAVKGKSELLAYWIFFFPISLWDWEFHPPASNNADKKPNELLCSHLSYLEISPRQPQTDNPQYSRYSTETSLFNTMNLNSKILNTAFWTPFQKKDT